MFGDRIDLEDRKKLRVMELAEFVNSVVTPQGPVHLFAMGSIPGQQKRWFMNGYSLLLQNKDGVIVLSILNCGRSLITGGDPRASELVIQQEFVQSRPWVTCTAILRERLREEYSHLYVVAFRECKDQIEKYNTTFPWLIKLLYKLKWNWKPKIFYPTKSWMNTLVTFEYKFFALWGGGSYKVVCERQLDLWRKKQALFPYLLDQTDSGIYSKNSDVKQPMLTVFKRVYTL